MVQTWPGPLGEVLLPQRMSRTLLLMALLGSEEMILGNMKMRSPSTSKHICLLLLLLPLPFLLAHQTGA